MLASALLFFSLIRQDFLGMLFQSQDAWPFGIHLNGLMNHNTLHFWANNNAIPFAPAESKTLSHT